MSRGAIPTMKQKRSDLYELRVLDAWSVCCETGEINRLLEQGRRLARKHSNTSPLLIMKSSCGKARLMGSPLDLEMTPRHTMP